MIAARLVRLRGAGRCPGSRSTCTSTSGSGRSRPLDGSAELAELRRCVRHTIELLHTAGYDVFSAASGCRSGRCARRVPDRSAALGVLAIAGGSALVVGARPGELLRERLRLGFWGAVALSRSSARLLVLLANAASVGASPDFVARYFVAFAAAYAALSAPRWRPWRAAGCGSSADASVGSRSARLADARPRLPLARRMSATALRDPFEVVDADARAARSRRSASDRRAWPLET